MTVWFTPATWGQMLWSVAEHPTTPNPGRVTMRRTPFLVHNRVPTGPAGCEPRV